MNILIAHGSLVEFDAIGNDMIGMADCLGRFVKISIFSETHSTQARNLVNLAEALRIVTRTDTVLIYHHSIYWANGMKLLKAARGKVFIKYHNITPPDFFAPYCYRSVELCRAGREQTTEMLKHLPDAKWLCDSSYNSQDLVGAESIEIVPPFNQVALWDEYKDIGMTSLSESELNLVFVGRIAPNKGQHHLLELVRILNTCFLGNVRLQLVGKCYTPLYRQYLDILVAKWGLEDNVEFVDSRSGRDLYLIFQESDAFVCASEHEGFCVPLIESQFLETPVVAMNYTVIPETLGENQLVVSKGDIFEMARAILELKLSSELRFQVVSSGKSNVMKRFSRSAVENRFCEALQKEGVAL